MGEPFGVPHHHVELIAVDDEIGLALRRGVHRTVDELHLTEVSAEIVAQELVVIARQHHHAGAGSGLFQQQLRQRVVLDRPVPRLRQAPAVDDVADQIDHVGIVPAQEVDELRDARRLHPQMHI